MKTAHWSVTFFDFITLEIPYDDGARQAWDYDISQYDTEENLRLNMAADFADPRMDRTTLSIYALRGTENYTAVIDVPDLTGEDFVDFVFEQLEAID